MSVYTLFQEGTGRPDLSDAEIDVFLDDGREFIRQNIEWGASDWNEDVSIIPVVLAAMYKYELLYRNREAANEHLEALGLAIKTHNYDFIDTSSRLITRMEG